MISYKGELMLMTNRLKQLEEENKQLKKELEHTKDLLEYTENELIRIFDGEMEEI